jgi:hypothetical protein
MNAADDAVMLTGLTGLSLDAATVLLEAAGGDISLAASLHFEAEPGALAQGPARTPVVLAASEDDDDDRDEDDDELTQRARARAGFSVLADAGASSSDDDIFAHISRPAPSASGRQKGRKARGKARGAFDDEAAAVSGGGGDVYDMLALTAADDEALAHGSGGGVPEMMPHGRKAKKAARSAPIRVPRQPTAPADDGSASDQAISPSPTSGSYGASGSAGATGSLGREQSHRRRGKRQGGSSSGTPSSYNPTALGLNAVASVVGFEAPSSGSPASGGASGGASAPTSVRGFNAPASAASSASSAALPPLPVRGFAAPSSPHSPPLARSAEAAMGASCGPSSFGNIVPPPRPSASVGPCMHASLLAGSLSRSPTDESPLEMKPQRQGSRDKDKKRAIDSPGARAERAISRLLWDPRFGGCHERVLVLWAKEEEAQSRKSGAAAWSTRVQYVPCETRLTQFVRASGSYLDHEPAFHLVREIRVLRTPAATGAAVGSSGGVHASAHHGAAVGSSVGVTLWASSWASDRLDYEAARAAGLLGGAEVGAGGGGGSTGGGGGTGGGSIAQSEAEDEAEEEGAEGSPGLVSEVPNTALPSEIWALVLDHIGSVRELCVMSSVCTELRELSYEPSLWEAHHRRLFGVEAPDDDWVLTMRRVRRSEATMQPWRRAPGELRAADAAAEADVAAATLGSGRGGGSGGGGSGGRSLHASPTTLPACSPPARGGAHAAILGTSPATAFALPVAASPPGATPPGHLAGHSYRWTVFTSDVTGQERVASHGTRALYLDGGLLATADGGSVRLWSVERRKRICTLKTTQGREELHAGGVSCMAIDGVHLLCGGGDGALHVFDLEELGSGRHATPRASLRGHSAPIADALLLPHTAQPIRARVASSSTDGVVRLWDGAWACIREILGALQGPPSPVPLAILGGGSATTAPTLYCGRRGELCGFDLVTEQVVSRLPLPSAHGTAPAVPLHIACSTEAKGGGADGRGGGFGGLSGGGPAAPYLIAMCCHHSACIHLWDARRLPAPPGAGGGVGGVGGQWVSWDVLPTASRRCLIATIRLPEGSACARQLHLDGARLLAAIDRDPAAPLFARGGHSCALFDVRAVGGASAACAAHTIAGAGADDDDDSEAEEAEEEAVAEEAEEAVAAESPAIAPRCVLWEQPVPGEVSCFHRVGEQVYVGTATGAVLAWRFSALVAADALGPPEDEGRDKRDKRDRRRAKPNPKVRSRFPKTQGFSNVKSIHH